MALTQYAFNDQTKHDWGVVEAKNPRWEVVSELTQATIGNAATVSLGAFGSNALNGAKELACLVSGSHQASAVSLLEVSWRNGIFGKTDDAAAGTAQFTPNYGGTGFTQTQILGSFVTDTMTFEIGNTGTSLFTDATVVIAAR